MYLSNPQIVLMAIYTHRDSQNITSYKTLRELLPLEKSHISQSLAQNEKNGYIQKPDSQKYYTDIQITLEGIQTAKRFIATLNTVLNKAP